MMNRYVTITGPKHVVGGGYPGGSDVEDQTFYVVDLQGMFIIAECGNHEGRADKIAQALNDLDGGPL